MSDLIKIIQDKKAEQKVLFNRFESVGNEAMKNIAAAKINILDEVLELANEVSTGSGQSNIHDVSVSSCPTCRKHNNPYCSNPWHLDTVNIR